MSKSKYPQKLDTSIELPTVRDNITELSSETINSLISAIFQIERTLGINPQGAAGNSVSARLSKALDGNGNIKKDALKQANVLSGPITNVDVSKVAAIKESKLRLDFPTGVLQSEVSTLGNQLGNLITQLKDINATLSVHIHPEANNRHTAEAITVAEAPVSRSATANIAIEPGSLQGSLEALYNGHVNYSGDNISELNNSHIAEQVFFNKENVSDVIFGDSVQGAIEDLADIQAVGLRNSTLNLNSNGRIRTGSTINGYEGNALGTSLLEVSAATFVRSEGATTTTFSLPSAVAPNSTISEFDILTLSGSSTETDNGAYQIKTIAIDGDGKVTSITIYGGPLSSSESGLSIVITKNIYGVYNQNGLNCAVRPRKNRTNTPDVIVSNPDSATIISSGIRPSSIRSTAHTFKITVDNNTSVEIETYDSSLSRQTLSSVVNKINEQAVDNKYLFYAYSVRVGTCHELALAHVLPNVSGDIKERTLLVSAGSSNDGSLELGISDRTDIKFYGGTGSTVHLNGLLLTGFGKPLSFSGDELELINETLIIELFSDSFKSYGVRTGDTVVIAGSSDASDDGAYRVKSIDDTSLFLDLDGSTFVGNLDSDSIVYILRNGALLDELAFEEIASSSAGSILFDIFLTEEKDIHYKKRLEIEGVLSSGSFTSGISDVSKNFIINGETASVTVGTDGMATLTDPTGAAGESVYVADTGIYELRASDGLSFIKINVLATAAPSSAVSVTLYGFNDISANNYFLSRGLYGTNLGRILGETADPGVPVLKDKRKSGTVDDTILGEAVLERYIEGPRGELRGSGIIKGMQVSGLANFGTYFTFDISAGVYYSGGIRYEFSGITELRIDTTSNFFIAINGEGCVVTGDEITNPGGGSTFGNLSNISPFYSRRIPHLAYIDSSDNSIEDLRLFVNTSDFKVASEILVGKNGDASHFSDIASAVTYAGRVTALKADLGTPTIKISAGTYEVSSQINIDFDINVIGDGSSTILKKATGSTLAAGKAPSGTIIFMTSALFLIGADTSTGSSRIKKGVSFSNFVYESNDLSNVGIVFALSQDLATSPDGVFRFHDISFFGPEGMDGSVADASKIGEYALYIGQQNSTSGAPSSSITMGNVLFSGCYLHKMGLGNGAVYFTESATGVMRDCVVTGNIAADISPNVGNTSVTIIELPSTPTSTRLVETGNAVSD